MTYRAMDVAKTFFELAQKDGKTLTNMHLQKLVFFAHGLNLGLHDEPLVKEKPRAWKWGPVFPELYNQLREFGRSPVEASVFGTNKTIDETSDEFFITKKIWDGFKDFTGGELSYLSHKKGSPWESVWNNKNRIGFPEIPEKLIREFYKEKLEV